MSRLFNIPQAVRINSAGTPYAAAKINFYLTGTTTPTDTYTDNARTVAHANPVVADSAGQWAAIYLDPDVTYRAVITESDDTGIDDVDPVHAPLTASDIALVDSAGNYAATDLEAAMTEVVTDNVQKAGGTMTGDLTMSSADIQVADNELVRPEIKDFGITHNAITSTSNAITADCATGNSFYHLLTENTTFTLSNPPATGTFGQITIFLKQDGAGGAYTVTWPASVVWPGGTAPTISTGNDALDAVSLVTIDAGTTWYGSFAQAYS